MKKEKKMTILKGIDYTKEKLIDEFVDTIFDRCDFSELAFDDKETYVSLWIINKRYSR